MTKCTQELFSFPACKRRKIKARFDGGSVTSDGGSLLLRQADRLLGLTAQAAEALEDPRRKASCEHSLVDLLRQRVYGIALGYEDLNDHETLRHDLAFQTATDRDRSLSSPSTLCRFENRMDREAAWKMNELLVETFIASFDSPPEELILDFDATDDRVHGQQEGCAFHGYYDHYCFLPLYVFCGEHLLVSYLRPCRIDGAKHTLPILKLLVKRMRQVWPKVRIIFRGDSGFCRWKTLRWCDRHNVFYIVGLAKNKRVNRLAQDLHERAENEFERTGEKQRLFGRVSYRAETWDCEREVIAKAEHSRQGPNPRYVVTNLPGDPQELYDHVYCARGDMENRIKEQQLDLFSDRTSCHRWWANQFRLLLSSLAYVLIQTIRRVGLKGTEMARAQCNTIRLKLFKIGAVLTRNTRSIHFRLSTAYPYQHLFWLVAQRLAPS